MVFVPTVRTRFTGEGDSVYPSQWFSRLSVHALPAEQRLMLAVLEHAVGELQRTIHAPDGRSRRLFAETVGWFASDDDTWPFSFVPICHALGIDVSYLRGGLERWRAAARAREVRVEIRSASAGVASWEPRPGERLRPRPWPEPRRRPLSVSPDGERKSGQV